MIIEASIKYWDDAVLTFDPEKVLNKLKKYFPQIEIDSTDYGLEEVKRIEKLANEQLEEPDRSIIISQIHGKNRANGPVFRFEIKIEGYEKFTGHAKRYSTEFNSQTAFDSDIENSLIEFLKSLEYGEIRSNTKTDYFCEQHQDFKDYWLLKNSV